MRRLRFHHLPEAERGKYRQHQSPDNLPSRIDRELNIIKFRFEQLFSQKAAGD